MKVLVTNDDGVHSPGLWALVRALVPLGQVVVCAPDREQSAVGTSITLHVPVRARQVPSPVEGVPTWAVEGTPGDSVILALDHLLDHTIGLVVSGINDGSNLGHDALISGTVGAALQGYFHGLPALAISVTAIKNMRYDVAAPLAAQLVRLVLEGRLSQESFLSVNVPNVPAEEIQGVEITKLGRRSYRDTVAEGHDGKRTYYWIKRAEPDWRLEPGTDIYAIERKYISITPLHTDWTCGGQQPNLVGLVPALEAALRDEFEPSL
ncbi:MAG: 5'/3'-nucleotidase SurE [Chloroflexi bacterium]|nr:5'/3'-nucleotidase SurE [Chloroflexota bacterium]